MKQTFFSKILLFGEYGIIKDSMGLSIPYNFYNGKLIFSDPKLNEEDNKESNKNLNFFFEYLNSIKELRDILYLDRLKTDIDKGLYFSSSIPMGYGIGSSGALVASVYNKYSINRIKRGVLKKSDIKELRKIFSLMENFFHGKSSGIDPLICYLKIPILINSKDDIETINIPKENENSNSAIFLLDSQIHRKADEFVRIFFEKLKIDNFKHIFNKFIEYNNDSIKSFLRGDITHMFHNIKELSAIVLANFSPMIPEKFVNVWKKGIDENIFYLKLCGAGGGGFFIGFTQDLEKTKKILKDFKIEVIQKL